MNLNPAAYPAAPAIPLRPSPIDLVEDSVFLMGLIYLEMGLPAEAAFQSALADFDCTVERSISPCRQ